MKVPNGKNGYRHVGLSLSRLQNEGSQLEVVHVTVRVKSIKATE